MDTVGRGGGGPDDVVFLRCVFNLTCAGYFAATADHVIGAGVVVALARTSGAEGFATGAEFSPRSLVRDEVAPCTLFCSLGCGIADMGDTFATSVA